MDHDSQLTRAAVIAMVLAIAVGLVVGCSSNNAQTNSAPVATTGSGPVRRPDAKPATLIGPVTTGKFSGPVAIKPVDLGAAGYVEEEFFAAGTANSYKAGGTLARDGRWTVVPDGSARYKTRIVVRRPKDPAKFNGSVVVEWFNVSGGVEADPDWAYLGPELRREGYAYVGVTTQELGINGGKGIVQTSGSPGVGLRTSQPDRYGSLVHPGDRFSFDIYSQIGAALRDPGGVAVLGHLQPKRILALGESQSAFYLTTYANAIQPTANVFDGLFIHSRSGGGAPLGDGTSVSQGTQIRTDLHVPAFIFETETDIGTDLLNYSPARQSDTDKIRVWEVAGTAHADAYLVGSAAGFLGCGGRVNEGPQHYVIQAAMHAFNRWVADGTAPPSARPIKLEPPVPPTFVRDANGIALGGVRTPSVDVPVVTLSGMPLPGSSVICSLFGSTTPINNATLTRLYQSKDQYLTAFDASLEKAVTAGFVLGADRAEYRAEAGRVAFPAG